MELCAGLPQNTHNSLFNFINSNHFVPDPIRNGPLAGFAVCMAHRLFKYIGKKLLNTVGFFYMQM